MAAPSGAVKIEGLTEFRAALRQAAGRYPTELTAALKKAGVPIVAQAASTAPRRSGALASGYKVAAAGKKASVVSRVPYAGGAEWGRFGKWSGFSRYGAPPRTVWPAVEQQAPTVMLIVQQELEDIMSAYGWFH